MAIPKAWYKLIHFKSLFPFVWLQYPIMEHNKAITILFNFSEVEGL